MITEKELEEKAIKAYGNDIVRGEGYIAGYKQRLWEEAALQNKVSDAKFFETMYLDIDSDCAHLEDILHGYEGDRISRIRKALKEYHDYKLQNKSDVSAEEVNQILKELSIYIDDIYNYYTINNGKDTGNLWIQFSDKFSALQRLVSTAAIVNERKNNIEMPDIEKLAEEWINTPHYDDKGHRGSFIAGYKAAFQNKVSDVSAGQIIKKNIPNGIVNIHAKKKGNGKPQYKAEVEVIKKCMEEYASIVNKVSNVGNEELENIFDNNSDCYADTRQECDDTIPPILIEGEVIEAMTKEAFKKVVKDYIVNKGNVCVRGIIESFVEQAKKSVAYMKPGNKLSEKDWNNIYEDAIHLFNEWLDEHNQ